MEDAKGVTEQPEQDSSSSPDNGSSKSPCPPKIIVYHPEFMVLLRANPLSIEWPSFLDETFKNSRGNWDPDRWMQNRYGSSPSTDDKASKSDRPMSSLSVDGKARFDAKERIRAEASDLGIVLSPQRRSFLSGCQGSQSSSSQAHAKDSSLGMGSMIGGGTGSAITSSNNNTNNNNIISSINHNNKKEEISLRTDTSRRIGSGRILSRERDEDQFDRDGGRRFERRSEDRFGNRDRGFRRDDNPEDSRRNRPGLESWFPRRDGDSRFTSSGADGRKGGSDISAGSTKTHESGRHDFEPRRSFGRYGRTAESEVPEWMSAPVSQDDMMELRGFDDSPVKEAHSKKFDRKQSKATGHKDEELREAAQQPAAVLPDVKCSTNKDSFNLADILEMDVIPGFGNLFSDDHATRGAEGDLTANDSMPGGERKANHVTAGSGSRFSQFFNRKSDMVVRENDLGSSLQDGLLITSDKKSIVGGHHQPEVRIPSPGDPSAYFAPISPAAKTNSEMVGGSSIMDMLKINATSAAAPSMEQLKGKNVRSVAELEADIKQLVGIQPAEKSAVLELRNRSASNNTRYNSSTDKSEMSAFEKFAALIGENSEPMNIPKSMGRGGVSGSGCGTNNGLGFPDHHHLQQQSRVAPRLIRPNPLPANAPTEQDILAGMSGPPRLPCNPYGLQQPANSASINPTVMASRQELLNYIHYCPFNVEALNRPEAHALRNALAAGQVTFDVLLQQLAHGNLPQPQREILLNVLKLAQSDGRFSQLSPFHNVMPGKGMTSLKPHSPLPMQHALLQQQQQPQHPLHHLHQQQQRVSPGMMGLQPQGPMGLTVSGTPANQRIPSPQELVLHTQQIMQNALIKRKLEEQKENYRRRQQMEGQYQQHQSESAPKPGTDSPLLFTPTVVMKKMAADRRDSDPKICMPELKVGGNPDSSKECSSRSQTSPHQPMQASGMNMPSGPVNYMSSQNNSAQHLMMMHQQPHLCHFQQLVGMPPASGAVANSSMDPARVVDPRLLSMLQNVTAQQLQHQQHHTAVAAGAASSKAPRTILPPAARLGAASSAQHTTPELSRFFSPEVLAQAGTVMPPLPTQKALTLEEIECQAGSRDVAESFVKI